MQETIKFLYGKDSNLNNTQSNNSTKGSLYLSTVEKTINGLETDVKSYLYFDNGQSKLNVVPKLLEVENGGTGLASLESGKALIGSGTSSVSFREITNQTSACVANNTDSLITENTLGHWTGEFKPTKNGTSQYFLSKLGTITIGTWNASIIKTAYGGTGNNSFTANRLLKSIIESGETKLVSTNHHIDNGKTIFFYDSTYTYPTSDSPSHFIVDGTVNFFTSKASTKNRDIKFEFNEHELTIQSPLMYATNGELTHNELIYEDVAPSLVFNQKTSSGNFKGVLKWGNNSKHKYNGLQLISSDTGNDLVFLTPELETNAITHLSFGRDQDEKTNLGTRKKVLQFFNAKTTNSENKPWYCSGVALGGGGLTYITGGNCSATTVQEMIEEEKKNKNFVTDQSIFCISDDAIGFLVGMGKEKTQTNPWTPCIMLDQDGNFYPDINNTCSIGTDEYNWSTVKALNLISNSQLTIKANNSKNDKNETVKGNILIESGKDGDIKVVTGEKGEIFLTAGTDRTTKIKKIHLNNLTYIKDNLILTGDIKYHNLEDKEDLETRSHSMIRFLRGNDYQAGISIGGKGMVAIGSGESIEKIEGELCADPQQGGLINGIDSGNASNNKKDVQTYIASDKNIYFYPNREKTDVGLTEYLIINTNNTLTSSDDNSWQLGTSTEQWKDIYSYKLTSTGDLVLKAGDFLNETAINKKIELNSYQTNVLGRLYLYDDIYYNNNNKPLKVIDFINGDANGTGIAIGGKGSIFIAAGESILNTQTLSISQGNYDNLTLASDEDIILFTSAETNSTTTKKTVLNSSGNIVLKSTSRGYYLTDVANSEYPGIIDNGADLWIGALDETNASHTGRTIISTGFNGINAGNESIYVAVPNNANQSSSVYKIFHENTTVPVTSGGTGKRSWTANRLIWTSDTTTLAGSNHYASSAKIAVNSTSVPTENFYVNGTSKFTGAMEVNNMLKIIQETTSGKNGDGVAENQISRVLEIYGSHYPGQSSCKAIDYQTAGPKIRFRSSDNQIVSLVFTGYDTAVGGLSGGLGNWATLGLVGSSTITPVFYSPFIQTEHITFNNNGHARHMITFEQGLNVDGTDNSSNGSGIIIGGGGRVVIGGGESARQFLKTKFPGYDSNGNDTKITTSTEHLFLTSDQYIQFFPGGNNWKDGEKLTEVSRIVMSRVDADFGSQIQRQVASGSYWWQGRKTALLRSTDGDGVLTTGTPYQALTSMKTKSGSWETGVWAGQANDPDAFVIAYTPDECFKNSANSKTVDGIAYSCKQPFKVLSSGAIAISNYNTSAPGASTPGYGVQGALYFKLV